MQKKYYNEKKVDKNQPQFVIITRDYRIIQKSKKKKDGTDTVIFLLLRNNLK